MPHCRPPPLGAAMEAEGSQAVTGVGELPEPGRALMTERRGPLCVFGRERGVAPRSVGTHPPIPCLLSPRCRVTGCPTVRVQSCRAAGARGGILTSRLGEPRVTAWRWEPSPHSMREGLLGQNSTCST